MGNRVKINSSAFRHGVSEESIRRALRYPQYEAPLEDDGRKYIVLGFDNTGNLLEILYNCTDDNTINVFHAMKCRKIYYSLLNA
jgi:hypothetical protein